MRRYLFGAVIALVTFGIVTGVSYVILNHFYGRAYLSAPSQNGIAGAPEKPLDVFPIAASIGVAMGIVVFAVWMGYQGVWGEATLTLLEHGLHDMTVRDVEIFRHIIELREFTVPELIKLTRSSRITIWRMVQKLVKLGLVRPTGQMKLAANGLGGRGKPSHVYEYVGKEVKAEPPRQ